MSFFCHDADTFSASMLSEENNGLDRCYCKWHSPWWCSFSNCAHVPIEINHLRHHAVEAQRAIPTNLTLTDPAQSCQSDHCLSGYFGPGALVRRCGLDFKHIFPHPRARLLRACPVSRQLLSLRDLRLDLINTSHVNRRLAYHRLEELDLWR